MAVLIVDGRWTIRRAAELFQVSPAAAAKWARRYRDGEPMTDCSSAQAVPRRGARRLEQCIVKLRYCRRRGPHRMSYQLGVPRSTVGRVLGRYRTPLLAHVIPPAPMIPPTAEPGSVMSSGESARAGRDEQASAAPSRQARQDRRGEVLGRSRKM